MQVCDSRGTLTPRLSLALVSAANVEQSLYACRATGEAMATMLLQTRLSSNCYCCYCERL